MKTQEKSKYIVKIDTTESKIKKIVLETANGHILEEATTDKFVVSELANLLKKHKIAINEICEIIPNPGPGSFTGIKTGITIANVFNWVTKDKYKPYAPDYGADPNITLSKELKEKFKINPNN